MAINSQLPVESEKQTRQTSRTETESQIWRSFGGLLVIRGMEENGGKDAQIKKYKLVGTKQTRCQEQYKKWRSQRTYMHDPWT